MQTVNVNCEGTTVRITIRNEDGDIEPVSLATIKKFKFRKPNGTSIYRNADFVTDGSDGCLQYVVLHGDIDQSGRWTIEAYVELPDGSWYTNDGEFYVRN